MESKLASYSKTLKKLKDNHPSYLGWYYFPNYSYPMLVDIFYVGKKTIKAGGTYHTFRIVSIDDKELVDTVIVRKEDKHELVMLYDLHVTSIYSMSKATVLTSLKSKKSNLLIQKNDIEKEIKHLTKLETAILEDDSEKSVKTCLLVIQGTSANAVFVTSVVKGLKVEKGYHRVDVLVGYPYMKQCLLLHPCIDRVWCSDPYTLTPKTSELKLLTIYPFDESYYDTIVNMNPYGHKGSIKDVYQNMFGLTKNAYDMRIDVPNDFVNYALSNNKSVKIGFDKRVDTNLIENLKQRFPTFMFRGFDSFDNLYEGGYEYDKVLKFNLTLGKMVTFDYIIGEPSDMLIVASCLGIKTITIKTSTNTYIERYGKDNVPTKLFPKGNHLTVPKENIEKKLVEMFATIENVS